MGKTVSIVVHQGGDSQKWSGRCLVSRIVKKEVWYPWLHRRAGCTILVGVLGEMTGKAALVALVTLRS